MPDGDAGARATLRLMTDTVLTYDCKNQESGNCKWHESTVPQIAAKVVAGATSYKDAMQRIYGYVNSLITYRQDPPDQEFIKSPCRLLREKAAVGSAYDDCDGYSVMIAAMLRAAGIRSGYMAVSNLKLSKHADPSLDHVFAIGYDKDNESWVPLDPVAPTKDWTGHKFMTHLIPSFAPLAWVASFFYRAFPARPEYSKELQV